MKVDSVDNSSSLIKLKKKQKIGHFALPAEDFEDESDVGSVPNSAKIPSFNPFLALQEVEGNKYEASENLKLIEEGNTIIDFLNQIRLGLLNGDLSINNIRNLKEVIEQKKHKFKTVEAQELYDDIYLRASVELAKLERSQK
jgi:Class II flagellar assembly regulator